MPSADVVCCPDGSESAKRSKQAFETIEEVCIGIFRRARCAKLGADAACVGSVVYR